MNLEDAELRMRSFADGDELGGFNDNNAAAGLVMKRYDELSKKNTSQGLRMAQMEHQLVRIGLWCDMAEEEAEYAAVAPSIPVFMIRDLLAGAPNA